MGLTANERHRLGVLKRIRREPKWRTFVHITGGHDKFWKVGIVGPVVWIEYGPNGHDGNTLRKSFDWPWQADDYVASKIHEKLNKGYEELT